MEPIVPKTRILRQVTLPQEVVTSLQEVLECIERGDEVTTIPTDDSIQIGPLCGGLMDDGSGRFFFSVHLADNDPYVWDIALTAAEIQKIVRGKMTAIPLWCCADERCGFKSYIEDITCHWCDYGGDRTPRRSACCSFCGKSSTDVGPLVAGPGHVYICGQCIKLCQAIVNQEPR
jgi:hypothetical protein